MTRTDELRLPAARDRTDGPVVGVARPRADRPGRWGAAVLEPRPPPGPGLRRDLLRQAGVLAAALRRRDAGARLAEEARRRVRRRQPERLLHDRRRHGRAPARRQVAHRRRRVAARRPGSGWGWRFSVALVGTLSILVVGRVGPAAVRVDGAGLRRGVPPRLRGLALRDVAHRHPRHHRVVLGAVRVRGAARRPRPQPRDPRREGRGPARAARWPDGRGPVARLAAVALGGRPVAGPVPRAPSGRACSSSRRSASCRSGGTWGPGGRPACAAGDAGRLLKDGPFAALAMVGTTVVVYVAVLDRAGSSPPSATTGSGTPSTPARGRSGCRRCCATGGSTTRTPTSSTPRCTRRTRTSRTRGRGSCRPGRRRSTTRARPGAWPAAPSSSARRRSTRSARSRCGGSASSPCSSCCGGGWCAATGGPGRSPPGFVGGYLPWFVYQDRTIYTFYAVAFEPWVVLAVVFLIGLWVGRREDDPERWRWRWFVVGGYLAAHAGAVRVLPPGLRRRHASRTSSGAGGCGSPAGSDAGCLVTAGRRGGVGGRR